MDLKKALKVLNIENYLEEKKKEGSDYIRRGLFESCNEINEAVKTVWRFIDESE